MAMIEFNRLLFDAISPSDLTNQSGIWRSVAEFYYALKKEPTTFGINS